MKLFALRVAYAVRTFFRGLLGINQDCTDIANDINAMSAGLQQLAKNQFDTFQALPFVAGILTLKASDAAKFVNAKALDKNSLVSLLTQIVLATRANESYLEVDGELAPVVRKQLEDRGFRIDDTAGTDEAKGTFIVWS